MSNYQTWGRAVRLNIFYKCFLCSILIVGGAIGSTRASDEEASLSDSLGDLIRIDDMSFNRILELAEDGVTQAKYVVGRHYIYGVETVKNYSLGLKWLKEAAEEGQEQAQKE